MKIIALLFFVVIYTSSGAAGTLTVNASEFILKLKDGRILKSKSLIGAVLTVRNHGKVEHVTINNVLEQNKGPYGSLFLHELTVRDINGRQKQFCKNDQDGKNFGFPLKTQEGGFEIICTSGAAGKCIQWGYRPWLESSTRLPFKDLYQACIHMVRADYKGDGSSGTKDGLKINFCDSYKIVSCQDFSPMAFEAAWGKNGSTCISRTRLTAKASDLKLTETDICQKKLQTDPQTLILSWSGMN